jgi:hypothetical protein
MSESTSKEESSNTDANIDLEKGGHPVPDPLELPRSRSTWSDSSTEYDDSRRASAMTDSTIGNPFGLYPQITLSMSSTKAPHALSLISSRRTRRGTLGSLGRSLTREETRQTLRTIRSRFTEVRDEFDENVFNHYFLDLTIGRYS